jgi:hypothetical protein
MAEILTATLLTIPIEKTTTETMVAIAVAGVAKTREEGSRQNFVSVVTFTNGLDILISCYTYDRKDRNKTTQNDTKSTTN